MDPSADPGPTNIPPASLPVSPLPSMASSAPVAIPRPPRNPHEVPTPGSRQFELSPVSDLSRSSSHQHGMLLPGSPSSSVPGRPDPRLPETEVASSFKSDMIYGFKSFFHGDLERANSLSGVSIPGSEARSELPIVGVADPSDTNSVNTAPHKPLKPPLSKKKSLRSQMSRESNLYKSTLSSLFSSGFMHLQHQASVKGSIHGSSPSGSRQHVNYVTEAQSVLPSFSSEFSVENIAAASTSLPKPSLPKPWKITRGFSLADDKISSSFQDHLEKTTDDPLSVFDNKEYMDTVKSTDSVRSWLTRSMSVPPKYEYHPSQLKGKLPGDEEVELQDSHKWHHKMEDVEEKPEYGDSIESTSSQAKLLGKTALAISKGHYGTDLIPFDEAEEDDTSIEMEIGPDPKEHLRYLKNLVVLSLSFVFIFISYMSLRNLQSSLNDEGGLGLIALSSVYASLFCGCIFATTVVQRLRPKPTIILGGIGFLVYTLANFYPHYYTLVPASCIAGFSLANMWTAHATYLTNIAARYAELRGKLIQNVISKFNGIFYMFFQTCQIWGGIIASNVLASSSSSPGFGNLTVNATDESSIVGNISFVKQDVDMATCGSSYCHVESNSSESSPVVEKSQLYTLVSIYTASVVIGIAVIWIFLDPLEGSMKKSTASVKDQLLAVFKFFGSKRVPCLLGLMFYSLLQNSFMFGEFTKAFVTCPIGVHMVGYTMLCLSACSAVASYINGRLQKHIGALTLFIIGGSIHLSLLLTMLLWKPTTSALPIYFVMAGLWGIGDGIFLTQSVSLFGILFPTKKEAAFAGLKMCQAIGACLLFVTAPYFCTIVKIYFMIFLLIAAVGGYVILDVVFLRKTNKFKKPAAVPV